MDANLLDVTAFLDDAHLSTDGRTLRYGGRDYDLTAGVLRLVESAEYVQGNSTKLRERHATLQLDSRNGIPSRRCAGSTRCARSPSG